jgi:HPt (histidine-containing phosphotransfer) domain-containing protein
MSSFGGRPSAAAPVVPAIDLDVVASLRQLGARTGRDVLGELTGMFVSTATAQLETAWRQLAVDELEDVARTAHALKGSGSVIGGRRIAAAAATLEQVVLAAQRAGGRASLDIETALRRLGDELDHFQEALRDLPATP